MIALALIILNLTKTLTGVLAIDIFIAYGPVVAFLPLIIGVSLINEEFIPSFSEYKAYKAKKKYVQDVNAAIRESVRSNQCKDSAMYQKFLDENPQYKA